MGSDREGPTGRGGTQEKVRSRLGAQTSGWAPGLGQSMSENAGQSEDRQTGQEGRVWEQRE